MLHAGRLEGDAAHLSRQGRTFRPMCAAVGGHIGVVGVGHRPLPGRLGVGVHRDQLRGEIDLISVGFGPARRAVGGGVDAVRSVRVRAAGRVGIARAVVDHGNEGLPARLGLIGGELHEEVRPIIHVAAAGRVQDLRVLVGVDAVAAGVCREKVLVRNHVEAGALEGITSDVRSYRARY